MWQGWQFNLGQNQGLGNIYYNTPGNWDLAWNQVVNGVGGQPGSNQRQWAQQQSQQAKLDFGNAVAQNPTLNVGDFLNKYVPGIGDMYDLQTSAQKGQQPGMFKPGRVMF